MGQVAQGYLLVPTVLGSTREWMAHLTELVLAWIAVLAMTSLIFRLGWDRRHAIVGALLLVSVAPFLPFPAPSCPISWQRPWRWWQWNGWRRGKPSGSGARARPPQSRWASQASHGPTFRFFFRSRHFSCSKASNPGRLFAQNPAENMALGSGIRRLWGNVGDHSRSP